MKTIKHNIKLSLTNNPTSNLQLPTLGGAGYQWQLVKGNQDIVEVSISSGTTDEESKKKPPGAAGIAIVSVAALKKGTTTINLIHKRPWEGDDGAAEKCEIEVEVTQ